MIEIIISLVLIGAIIFLFGLDGDKSKIPFLNKKLINQKESSSKVIDKISNNKDLKLTQKRLPFESIKSSGSVTDKALIIKDDTTYIGVVEIYGVNYNLLSVYEKLQLEEAFQRVLNGIDYPIQLFIQSKKMDIDNYNHIYEERLDELRELQKREVNKLNFLKGQDSNDNEINDVERNIKRLENQIQYGMNVIQFINNIAYNSDILDKKYYIATPYNYDKGLFSHEQTEEEKFQTAYNTLSNRLDSILSGLSIGKIEGKVLNGEELAELLYSSFNKHDSSDYKVANAMKSGFSNYVVTSRPVEHKLYEYEENKLIELARDAAI
ncbi:hypothetical protein NE686_17190 [Tissierella carlieri]|uniref:TraC-like domain-containing protein n=1 Tax=Tissierella carlieri TaxID=689904 RepID=A0ABT1SEX9_9FIRM|nr:hypothetical protein [Tissierella carlieri]MCQ4924840.1 hypothetical protein [Tissierella carlieri]